MEKVEQSKKASSVVISLSCGVHTDRLVHESATLTLAVKSASGSGSETVKIESIVPSQAGASESDRGDSDTDGERQSY